MKRIATKETVSLMIGGWEKQLWKNGGDAGYAQLSAAEE